MKTAIDGDSIIWICHWDTLFKSWEKPLNIILKDIDKLVSKILIETKAKEYLGFIGESRGFRKQLFSDYKSNRDNVIRPPYLSDCKDYLISEWNFIKLNEIEPDDAVSILKNSNTDVIISAIDKDILKNIPGKHYNYKSHEWIETSYFDSQKHFWGQMITGDTADGVKGIPNKGIKYFEKVILNLFLDKGIPLHTSVLEEYIKHFGEYEGIKEFYKNYILLKMLTEYEGFNPEWVNVDVNKLMI